MKLGLRSTTDPSTLPPRFLTNSGTNSRSRARPAPEKTEPETITFARQSPLVWECTKERD